MNRPLEEGAAPAPERRVVMIGASNVSLALPIAVTAAERYCGSPLEVICAAGHGRSFGLHTRVLGRGLPPILHCGMWEELAARPSLPMSAIVTDIGNDLLYGAPVSQVAEWVKACLNRLRPHAEHLVMTELPLTSAGQIGPLRFLLARTFIVPTCRLSRREVKHRAFELNERIIALAKEYRAELIRPDDDWYGLDPIHIRRSRRQSAWQRLLSSWQAAVDCPAPINGVPQAAIGKASPEVRRALRFVRPLHWTRFGQARHRAQPCARFLNGTHLSLF